MDYLVNAKNQVLTKRITGLYILNGIKRFEVNSAAYRRTCGDNFNDKSPFTFQDCSFPETNSTLSLYRPILI